MNYKGKIVFVKQTAIGYRFLVNNELPTTSGCLLTNRMAYGAYLVYIRGRIYRLNDGYNDLHYSLYVR